MNAEAMGGADTRTEAQRAGFVIKRKRPAAAGRKHPAAAGETPGQRRSAVEYQRMIDYFREHPLATLSMGRSAAMMLFGHGVGLSRLVCARREARGSPVPQKSTVIIAAPEVNPVVPIEAAIDRLVVLMRQQNVVHMAIDLAAQPPQVTMQRTETTLLRR